MECSGETLLVHQATGQGQRRAAGPLGPIIAGTPREPVVAAFQQEFEALMPNTVNAMPPTRTAIETRKSPFIVYHPLFRFLSLLSYRPCWSLLFLAVVWFIAGDLELVSRPMVDQFSSVVGVPGTHEELRFHNLGEAALRRPVQLALDASVVQLVANDLRLVDIVRRINYVDFVRVLGHLSFPFLSCDPFALVGLLLLVSGQKALDCPDDPQQRHEGKGQRLIGQNPPERPNHLRRLRDLPQRCRNIK